MFVRVNRERNGGNRKRWWLGSFFGLVLAEETIVELCEVSDGSLHHTSMMKLVKSKNAQEMSGEAILDC